MRNKFPLATALALCGLLASCDDGRYLVGILGKGPTLPCPATAGPAARPRWGDRGLMEALVAPAGRC